MGSYRIQPGDTLTKIASRYGTTVSELARENNISNPDLIYAGASLRVPGHSTRDTFDQGGSQTGGTRQGAGTDRTNGTGGVAPANLGDASATQRRLAEAGRNAALSMGGYNSQGLCATGVSRAISSAMGIHVGGNGNQIDNNLPRSRFREVNMSLEEALRTPGLVLTWERTSSRLGSIYGHTAITAGDGHTSYSDFIERNTTNNGRSGLRIFVPIQ